jgi:membrane protease YdiL (CAAX protease family)
MKFIIQILRSNIVWLWAEFIALFLGLPVYFYFNATRWNIHLTLWVAALYSLFILRRVQHFSWRNLWQGAGWRVEDRKQALIRFSIAAPLIILFTYYIAPERMFSFPLQRPWFWLLVMVLYPILSVIPQEMVFRSFFFHRYKPLFSKTWAMILVSGLVFGFIHIVFHNFVSPSFCIIGGWMFAYSYSQHQSLKWAMVEHAAYGCLVFTVGIGFYFLVGGGALMKR